MISSSLSLLLLLEEDDDPPKAAIGSSTCIVLCLYISLSVSPLLVVAKSMAGMDLRRQEWRTTLTWGCSAAKTQAFDPSLSFFRWDGWHEEVACRREI